MSAQITAPSRTLSCAVCIVAALSGLLVVSADASWFPDFRLTRNVHDSETALNNVRTVVCDSSGCVHVVWEDNRSGNYEIYYRKFDGLGWSGDERLTHAGGASQRAGLAAGGSGDLHVVWVDERDGDKEIYYKKYNGESWGDDERLTDCPGYSGYPSVVAEPDGEVHVVWYDERTDSIGIYYKRFDGVSWGEDVCLTRVITYVSCPCVALDETGNLHIVWSEYRDGDYEVYYKKWDGSAWGPDERLTDSPGYSRYPSVVAGGGGALHVIWQDYRDGNYEIYYKGYDGGSWGEDQRVTDAAGDGYKPSGAIDQDGTLHVVWQDYRYAHWEIYHITYDGYSWSASERVTAKVTGDSKNPSIATDEDDNLHLVWCDDRDGNDEIYWKECCSGIPAKPEIISIEPAIGYRGETAYHVALFGSGFIFPDSVWLEKEGEGRLVALNLKLESHEMMTVDIGLQAACLGFWDVITWNPDGQMDTLVSAFNVTPERWGEDIRLTYDSAGSYTSGNYAHCIAADSLGNLSIVWYDDRTGTEQVYHKRYDSGGWGEAECLTHAAEPARCPAVCMDLEGNTHVVWEDDRAGHPEVYYEMYDGLTWTPDTCLTCDSIKSEKPCLVADDQGAPHLAWLDYRDGSGKIYYKKKLDGGGWSSDERVTDLSGKAKSPSIAVDRTGKVHAAWIDVRGTAGAVFYSRREAGIWSSDVKVSTVGAWNASIAADQEGVVYVVWAETRSGAYYEIYCRRFDGESWAAEERLTYTDAWSDDPSLAVDHTGMLHMVYRDDPWGTEIFHMIYDGSAWQEPLRLTYAPYYCYRPSMAFDGGGNAHIVWTDRRDGNDEIYYKRRVIEHPAYVFEPESHEPFTHVLRVGPNPLRGSGWMTFGLASPNPVTISIYDTMGRLVWKRTPGEMQPGLHAIPWDCEDRYGNPVSAGVYFAHLEAANRSSCAKIVVVR
jgi:dTDP-4-dehydrorhamnose 3,5-epimerase-like enzyme